MTERHLMVIGYLQSIIEALEAGEIDNFKTDIRMGAVKIAAGALSEEEQLRFDGSFGVTISGVRRKEREEFNGFKADCPHLVVDQGVWRIADKPHRQWTGEVFFNDKRLGECEVIAFEVTER